MIGETISHYRIVAALGAGGMGVVYKADDTRLPRQVALKFLPSDLSHDAHAVDRFQREARVVSSLNHPHICTLYDVGEHEGRQYIVMELLEGRTLKDALGDRRLTISEIVDIGIQLADALGAAHSKGIVHRDLKPGNIFLTNSGPAKVLDFGLAKLVVEPARVSAVADQAGQSTEFVSSDGTALGTVAYMSPEQARAETLDARTDLFSLGVVLYEMAAGMRPFAGPSSAVIFDAILNRTPQPPSRLNSGVPPGLEYVIDKALEKNREDRYQSAKEVIVDLRRVKRELESGRASAVDKRQAPSWRQAHWSVLGVLAIAAAAAIATGVHYAALGERSVPPDAPMRTTPFTALPGRELSPTFSPDGNQVAFIWADTDGNQDLYIKQVGTETPLRLTTTRGAERRAAWSPDGRYIAFARADPETGGIFLIPALGGAERRLAVPRMDFDWDETAGLSWSPDAKFIAFPDAADMNVPSSVFLVAVDRSTRRKLTSPPASSAGDSSPAISPDGQTVAFVRSLSGGVSDVYVVPFAGGEPRRLTSVRAWLRGVAWTPDSAELVFAAGGPSESSLWRVQVSGGQPVRLPVGGDHAAAPAISRASGRLAYVQTIRDSNIWQLDTRQPDRWTKLIASTRHEAGPQFSPDGHRIVFHSDRSGATEIWVCDADGRNQLQLTSLGHPLTGTPRWSPDGRQVAFDSRVVGTSDIYVVDAQGGRPRQITTDPSEDTVPSWSRDGRWLYFASNRTGRFEVWKVAISGNAAVQLTKDGGFAAFESADGRLVYFTRGPSERGLWRVDADGGNARQVSSFPEPEYWGFWALASNAIYYVDTSVWPLTLQSLSDAGARPKLVATLPGAATAFEPGLAVSPDGYRILYTRSDESEADIVLVDKFR